MKGKLSYIIPMFIGIVGIFAMIVASFEGGTFFLSVAIFAHLMLKAENL